MKIYTDYTKIWGNAVERYMAKNNTPPLFESEGKDRRFKNDLWDRHLVFDFLKQSYLFTDQWMHNYIDKLEVKDPDVSRKLKFYTKQFADALSPTNFVLTNPEVIKETIEKKGANIISGLKNLLDDIEHSSNVFNVKTIDKKAFSLGENIAASKGKVVFENELMQLIQYQPTGKQSFEVPLLLVPAWINKYYILELSSHKSFVKWLVEQGYTVFIISWVNPDKTYKNTTLSQYMEKGPLVAIEQIEKATGQKKINAIGYCLGGTLLACTVAYLKARNIDSIASASFLTTVIDFSEPGDIGLFINEKQIKELDIHMKEQGYLDGSEMSAVFSAIRANDLVWSFVINNYLLGKTPFPFDILYWNSDATRIPAAAHSFYLKNMYLENNLIKPDALKFNGTPLDIGKIDIPSYFLSTEEDHIALWQPTYNSLKHIGGEKRFVLTQSGHVAGVINHPEQNKYGYKVNDDTSCDADIWQKNAKTHQGSWWNDWHNWNKDFSGKKVAAPTPGSGKLKPIEDAPGSYVKVRSDS